MPALLVIGGARSGKSRYAQARAEALGGGLVYVATAEAHDGEMAARIARHRADRDTRWRTVEAPLALADTIAAEGRAGAVLLIDCLTLWASNLLVADRHLAAALPPLVRAIAASPAAIILVTNEVGLGIVPDNALARRFRDMAGEINQAIAATAGEVVLMTAGLPLVLKGSAPA